MTLIAGFISADGFVISADTEVGLGDIRYQQTKLIESQRKHGSPPFWLVVGGAGHGDYLEDAMQELARAVERLKAPTVRNVNRLLRAVVRRHYTEVAFKHWQSDDPQCPHIGLVVGLRDMNNEVVVWKTVQLSVSAISDRPGFIGTGTVAAEYVVDTLMPSPCSVPITHHLATQIMREAGVKSAAVGGNIDIHSVRRIR